jgi:hypothetical protein
MAKRPVISPPGELTYMTTSLSGSSDSRISSWAMIRLATVSSTGVPKKMMRSFASRE